MALSSGTRLGVYEVSAKIGEGGMGAVYRAHDPTLQRTVAIKVLAKQDADASARLLEEARTASALDHPNICTVYEVGEHEGQRFIAMAYIQGTALRALIPPDGLPPETAIRYGTQIADALAHAHERGIVHRDLKSQNVVITPEGRAMVLDFGLAARMPQTAAEAVTRTREALPHAGMLVGTLGYMAPEVLRGEAATARSDIWALGVLLYEMASGRLPFDGQSVVDVTAAILKSPPSPLGSHVPSGLQAIAQRALAKEAGQRYASSGEVRAALEALGSSGATHTPPADDSLSLPSIAVLPFTNLSSDPEQDYFCEGLAEEIINTLTGINGLRVAARTSSFSFKGTATDATHIGDRLRVNSVLEGSVRTAGKRLRITAQLIDVSNGFHLWSDRFDREMNDIFAVQEEIARAIAERLDVAVATTDDGPLVTPPTSSIEAYQAYLKGRFLVGQKGSLGNALGHFERAVALDSTFALAHAGVADAHAFARDLGMVDTEDAARHADTAVTRALELDPTLAAAHVTRAWLAFAHHLDWDRADHHFARALELAPNTADVHSRYALYLALFRRRFDEAVAEGERAIALEPLSESDHTWLGCVLTLADRLPEAIDRLLHAGSLDPTSWHAHFNLGGAYWQAGQYSEAIAELHTALDLSGRHPWALGFLGLVFSSMDDARKTEAILDELNARSRAEHVPAGLRGALSAKLGRLDEAVDLLERAYEARDPWLCHFRRPVYSAVGGHPRLAAVIKRLNLPD